MPFDNPQLNQEMLYRQRRESAIALWETIPDQVFDIRKWRTITTLETCETVCCALGWLGVKQHDGWDCSMIIPRWSLDFYSYHAAALYFGITQTEAFSIFSTSREFSIWGNRLYQIGLRDISKALRNLPVTLNV